MSESGQTFIQSDAIRDHVFPLIEVKTHDSNVTESRFRGTGFLIGNRSIGLTAAHVLRGVTAPIMALFATTSGFRAYAIQNHESHSAEDVAIFSIEPPSVDVQWRAFTTFSGQPTRSSAHYRLFVSATLQS